MSRKGRRTPARIPSATYRLQFNQQFTFEQAEGVLDYLRELGVSDCYASPIFQAGPESTHGYDICDFNTVNPALGTLEQFNSFASAIGSRGMGLLLDMVPNHMGCDCSNAWWRDVLAKGRESAFAEYFDIDWSPPHTDLRDKVLLPILEDHYGKVLEAGKLRLGFEEGAFRITYYDKAFPVSRGSSAALLSESQAGFGGGSSTPQRGEGERRAGCPSYGEVKKLLEEYNGVAGKGASFDRLDGLLQSQHYRLAYWRTGLAEINYRRFFDVMGLVSMRMERREVFEASHRLVFEMIGKGQVTGLRIDHPDGLWDPRGYFARLEEASQGRLYVVAEKILSGDERLPDEWAVEGTTGYDFLNRVNGLFVSRENAAKMDEVYRSFTGMKDDLQSIIYAGKEEVLRTSLKSELAALAHRLRQLGKRSRAGQDVALEDFCAAVAGVVVTFPVYRSYVDEGTEVLPEKERGYVQHALKEARERWPELDAGALEFLGSLLLLEGPRDLDAQGQCEARRFVMRFQQLTGPVMAKGLEDTAFYRFNRLVSLNEVGGDPGCFGTGKFHELNQERARDWPHSLLATATHDTKRGEDVRARINVISELPEEWKKAVEEWRKLNGGLKREVNGHAAPSANDEYLLYQTVVGAWPEGKGEGLELFRERVRDYMLKAVREAKAQTSWLAPNRKYEEALTAFVEGVLQEKSPFLKAAEGLRRRLTFFGRFNSLSQTVLKLTCPGIPDIYQGTELWDLSLVDPDNRRAVDYELRRRIVAEELSVSAMGKLLVADPEGRLKLHVLRKLLGLRKSMPELFASGSYVPLHVSGPEEKHVLAFARELRGESVIVLVTRLVCTLMGGEMRAPTGGVWKKTAVELPKSVGTGPFVNAVTEQSLQARGSGLFRIDLAEAFAGLPFAVLRYKRENGG